MIVMGAKLTPSQLRQALYIPGHRASKFNRCVGGKLFGSHPGTQKAAREAFTAAAKACK